MSSENTLNELMFNVRRQGVLDDGCPKRSTSGSDNSYFMVDMHW